METNRFLVFVLWLQAPALIDAVSQGNNRSRKNAVQQRQAQARRGPLRPKNKTERQCNRSSCSSSPATFKFYRRRCLRGCGAAQAHLNPF